jgi:hypothetical protein
MKLTLERLQLDPDVTIGSLSIDGQWQCWTLEDVVRPAGAPKVFGQTAIPYGTYGVDITMSPHFGRLLPLVVNVPGFSGVRIHPGNTAADTEGCILVGQDRLGKSLGHSRAAFDALFPLLRAAIAKGPVTLEIPRP